MSTNIHVHICVYLIIEGMFVWGAHSCCLWPRRIHLCLTPRFSIPLLALLSIRHIEDAHPLPHSPSISCALPHILGLENILSLPLALTKGRKLLPPPQDLFLQHLLSCVLSLHCNQARIRSPLLTHRLVLILCLFPIPPCAPTLPLLLVSNPVLHPPRPLIPTLTGTLHVRAPLRDPCPQSLSGTTNPSITTLPPISSIPPILPALFHHLHALPPCLHTLRSIDAHCGNHRHHPNLTQRSHLARTSFHPLHGCHPLHIPQQSWKVHVLQRIMVPLHAASERVRPPQKRRSSQACLLLLLFPGQQGLSLRA